MDIKELKDKAEDLAGKATEVKDKVDDVLDKTDIDDKIIDVSTYKGRVALLTGDSVLLYGKEGGFISKNELRSDPHTVVLYTGSDAYVLCTGYIETMSL